MEAILRQFAYLFLYISCALAPFAHGAGEKGAPAKSFNLSIARGALPPEQRVLRVEKGDAVRLRVLSDSAGELHLHGYRMGAKVQPGKPAQFTFKAFATGRYAMEWHPASEGTPKGAHRGAPLATLEVRPK